MIEINDKLRIKRRDDRNLIIEEFVPVIKKDNKRTEYKWLIYGYYGDLKMALQGVLKHELFNIPKEKLKLQDIITKIEKIETEIKGVKL